jgi:hypothetical protein
MFLMPESIYVAHENRLVEILIICLFGMWEGRKQEF